MVTPMSAALITIIHEAKCRWVYALDSEAIVTLPKNWTIEK